MDRFLDNEGLLVCSMTLVLANNKDKDIAWLDLVAVLIVDRTIRRRLINYVNYESFKNGESKFDAALNRKFKELQPVIVNALTIMLMTGLFEFKGGQRAYLTEKGERMAMDLTQSQIKVKEEIEKAVSVLSCLLQNVSTLDIYKDLKIIL